MASECGLWFYMCFMWLYLRKFSSSIFPMLFFSSCLEQVLQRLLLPVVPCGSPEGRFFQSLMDWIFKIQAFSVLEGWYSRHSFGTFEEKGMQGHSKNRQSRHFDVLQSILKKIRSRILFLGLSLPGALANTWDCRSIHPHTGAMENSCPQEQFFIHR